MQLKRFVGHESCPDCGSADNVGVWSDGQKYCFGGCGYFVPGWNGMNIEGIKAQLIEEKQKDKTNGPVSLPLDFSFVLREDAQQWLNKYGITDGERMKHHIGWSDLYESLVLPSSDLFGNWLVVQRRYFGTGPWPKYHTRGRPESCVWTCRPSDPPAGFSPEAPYDGTIVVVEDYVSAIKVGRQFEATPLWGSSLSDGKLAQLAKRWDKIVFWLDYNKTKEALGYRVKAAPYFSEAWVISTEGDPKDYQDGAILEYLSDHTDS